MAQTPVSQLEQTKASLARMQQFDTSKLPRTEELGSAMNFQEAVEPAIRLIDLYKQLAIASLGHIPDNLLVGLKQQFDNDYKIVNSVILFDIKTGNIHGTRPQLIQHIQNAYEPAFIKLHPYISYSTRTATDFSRIEREARAQLQSAEDDGKSLRAELKAQTDEVHKVLAVVRQTAEEQGVSQQAIYFSQAADAFQEASFRWLVLSCILTFVLIGYAIMTLFMHKWASLASTNVYDTAQLAVSKVLIFATISFALIHSVKNYLANRHNAVVNRHRQNALATYKALVEAAGAAANRDVILTKAADCIFTAQATAFSKFEGADGGNVSLVNVPGGINPAVM